LFKQSPIISCIIADMKITGLLSLIVISSLSGIASADDAPKPTNKQQMLFYVLPGSAAFQKVYEKLKYNPQDADKMPEEVSELSSKIVGASGKMLLISKMTKAAVLYQYSEKATKEMDDGNSYFNYDAYLFTPKADECPIQSLESSTSAQIAETFALLKNRKSCWTLEETSQQNYRLDDKGAYYFIDAVVNQFMTDRFDPEKTPAFCKVWEEQEPFGNCPNEVSDGKLLKLQAEEEGLKVDFSDPKGYSVSKPAEEPSEKKRKVYSAIRVLQENKWYFINHNIACYDIRSNPNFEKESKQDPGPVLELLAGRTGRVITFSPIACSNSGFLMGFDPEQALIEAMQDLGCKWDGKNWTECKADSKYLPALKDLPKSAIDETNFCSTIGHKK